MTQLTENLTVWELWYFKAVTSYRGERFQVPTRLTTVTRQNGEYKVDLTRHPKFPLVFAVVSHTVLILLLHMTGWPLTYLYMIILHDRVTAGTSTLFTHDRLTFDHCTWSSSMTGSLVLILLLHMTGRPLTYLYMIILHDRITGTSTLITHDRLIFDLPVHDHPPWQDHWY